MSPSQTKKSFQKLTMRWNLVSGIRRRFQRLSQSPGQVAHVLLTRSPLIHRASSASPFDLHVLSTPPAFILSQDQTLRKRKMHTLTGIGESSEFETDQKDKSLLTIHTPTPKCRTLIQRNLTSAEAEIEVIWHLTSARC